MKFTEFLIEQAKQRKDVESIVSYLAEPLIEHLIKVLKWEDDLNFKKHCISIEDFIFDIEKKSKIKNNKLPKAKDYYQWIFYDTVQNQYMVDRWINRLRNYHNLQSLRTNEEVYCELQRIVLLLSKDLSTQQVKDVEHYLKGD